MIFQGPTEFSILTINVRAQLPRKQGQPPLPLQVPGLRDIQPRCSTIWHCLSDILQRGSAGNIRFTSVLAVREHAAEADSIVGGPWRHGTPVSLGKASMHSHRDSGAMSEPQDAALHPGHR